VFGDYLSLASSATEEKRERPRGGRGERTRGKTDSLQGKGSRLNSSMGGRCIKMEQERKKAGEYRTSASRLPGLKGG